MAVLHMTLTEEGVTFLRDALLCLAKFSEEVTIEARRDQVCLPMNVVAVTIEGLLVALLTPTDLV